MWKVSTPVDELWQRARDVYVKLHEKFVMEERERLERASEL